MRASSMGQAVAPPTGTAGAPTSGWWIAGAMARDSNGLLWLCTRSSAAAGDPGTWALASGVGSELASAELSSDSATFTIGAATDIAGLAITFAAPPGPFLVELHVPILIMSANGLNGVVQITDGANTGLAWGYVFSVINTISWGITLRARLPRLGGTPYPITPGQSYTFKARGGSMSSGTAYLYTQGGVTRPILRAVAC